MKKKLYKLFISPLPQQHRMGFNKDFRKAYFLPLLCVGLLIVAFEIRMIVFAVSDLNFFGSSNVRSVYIILYVVLLAVTAAFSAGILLFYKFLKKRPDIFRQLAILYSWIISLWGSFVSAYGHSRKEDISVFIYVILCSSIIVCMPFWQAIIVYGSNLIFFYACLNIYAGPEVSILGSRLNSGIVCLLAIAITTIFYHNRTRNYLNNVTIQEQSLRIRTINEQLQTLVLTDDLTKARNRRFFEDVLPTRLQLAFDDKKSVSVMMLDIDFFKGYNDIYGHQAGDICLQTLSKIVRETFTDELFHFVRYGGEEFLIFAVDKTEDVAFDIAEAVRRNLDDKKITHRGSSYGNLTLSIGLYHCPAGKEATLQRFVHNADEALYCSKSSGRNCVQIYGKPVIPCSPKLHAVSVEKFKGTVHDL